jgi:hypothetical protein
MASISSPNRFNAGLSQFPHTTSTLPPNSGIAARHFPVFRAAKE